VTRLNPLLSEAGFSTDPEARVVRPPATCLNPLLSEAGFSTVIAHATPEDVEGRLNPLLSEAGFSTPSPSCGESLARRVLILF